MFVICTCCFRLLLSLEITTSPFKGVSPLPFLVLDNFSLFETNRPCWFLFSAAVAYLFLLFFFTLISLLWVKCHFLFLQTYFSFISSNCLAIRTPFRFSNRKIWPSDVFFFFFQSASKSQNLLGEARCLTEIYLDQNGGGLRFCSAVYLDKMIRRMQTIILEIIQYFFLTMLIRSSFNFLLMTFSIKVWIGYIAASAQRSSKHSGLMPLIVDTITHKHTENRVVPQPFFLHPIS